MFAKVSKISAPLAGVLLLVSAGLATSASAAPQAGKFPAQTPQAEFVVKVDHRHGHDRGEWNGRRGGHGDWNGRHGGHHYEMGPKQIRRSLRHRGFHRIKIIDRRGPMYIVKARTWGGLKMRLVVDSRNAQIVRSRPMGDGRRGHWNTPWYY